MAENTDVECVCLLFSVTTAEGINDEDVTIRVSNCSFTLTMRSQGKVSYFVQLWASTSLDDEHCFF